MDTPREPSPPPTGRGVAEQVKASARAVADQATRAAAEVAGGIQERGGTLLGQQKAWVADELGHIGAALHAAAQQFHQGEDENLACYAGVLGDRADTAASYLRNHELGDLVDDVRDLARRHPEWVAGGLFVAGVLTAQFLKSADRPAPGQRGYERFAQRRARRLVRRAEDEHPYGVATAELSSPDAVPTERDAPLRPRGAESPRPDEQDLMGPSI